MLCRTGVLSVGIIFVGVSFIDSYQQLQQRYAHSLLQSLELLVATVAGKCKQIRGLLCQIDGAKRFLLSKRLDLRNVAIVAISDFDLAESLCTDVAFVVVQRHHSNPRMSGRKHCIGKIAGIFAVSMHISKS